MLSTAVVNARSTIVVMRSCISFGENELGKMSVGTETMDRTPRTAMNIATTTKV